MGKKKAKRKQPSLRVSAEISRTRLSMIIVEGSGEARKVRGHHMNWLQDAGSLNTEDGLRELAAALTTLVTKERLDGAHVHVALSSDFCITRAMAGESERIRNELRNLRERVGQYLLLGAGEKAIAESARHIDAKRVQAWLTVCNTRTLDHVVRAFEQANLHVKLIEHAMVAMCRAMGNMGRDRDAPVLIAEVNRRGVDLGVSYRGQLLFDYRPGGVDSKGKVAEIVRRHLQRIQRYCDREFRFAGGQITEVFICGVSDEVEPIRRQFAQQTQLAAEVLDPKTVCPEWEYDQSAAADLGFFSAIGSALVEPEKLSVDANQRGLPNLMDYYRSGRRQPLMPTLAKTCWPIAAALALSLAIFTAAMVKHRRAAAVERQTAQFDKQLGQLRVMKVQTQAATSRLTSLRRIDEGRVNPAWHQLITMIGHSMPEGIWLDSVRIEDDGGVSISGPSQTEDLIFDFVKYLKRVPVLTNVNLESQRPTRTSHGPAILFDIKCRYSAPEDLSERTASNG